MDEQPPTRSSSTSRLPRLSYANVVATLALFIALGSGAWAAIEIGRNDVTAREIAKAAVGSSELKNDGAKGKDVDESSLGQVPSASSATTAATAQSAQSAQQLDGLSPASINAASSGFGEADCDPGQSETCATTQLNQPRTSDVLVLASGTMFGTGADVSGSCTLHGPGNDELAGITEIGQVNAPHPNVDRGDGFVVQGLFQDVPAGPGEFELSCSEDTGDLKISSQQITAMRLSG